MGVDRALVRLEGHAAHGIQQLRACEHPPRLAGHRRDDLELALRQIDTAARKPRLHPWDVELHVGADADHVRRKSGAFRPAQHCAHARDQLFGRKRLGQIIVGPKLQADQLVRLLGARGEHDDRHLALAPQRAGDIQTVETRKAQIQDDQVRPSGPGGPQRARTVMGREHGEPTVL